MAFSSKGAEINVTPLIDVLLVLLIIFMVIAPNVQRGLDSELPQGGAATKASVALPPIVIEVTGTDEALRYRVNRQDVSVAGLPGVLRTAFAARQDRVAFVRASHALTFQPVAAVVATAKQAGATEVSLDSRGPETI